MQALAHADERPSINIVREGVVGFTPLLYPIFDWSMVRVKPWHALTVFDALFRQIATDLDSRMVEARYRAMKTWIARE
jgi:hypothetical protein